MCKNHQNHISSDLLKENIIKQFQNVFFHIYLKRFRKKMLSNKKTVLYC